MNSRQALLLLLLMTLFFTQQHSFSQKTKQSVQLPDISKEIMKMRENDQKNRIKWANMIRKGKNNSQKFIDFTREVIAVDRKNTARMREIISRYVWPTYDLVGKEASNGAWLIIQHADRNPLFQAKCLTLLKTAVDNGQANPSNYAYLYDRVQVSRGEMQLYATQSSTNNGLTEGQFYPIEDESGVQIRREEMGISRSVEEYAQSMGFDYSIPTVEEAENRAKKRIFNYETNLRLARKAMNAQDYTTAAEHYLIVARSYGMVTTQDFIEASKALALSQHKDIVQAYTFLTRAMTRGWDGFNDVKDHADFAFLRQANKGKWSDLLITAEEMKLDR
ncbi:DUF6624 domain-containing protein [Muriicola soli]|uniref:Sel1 repeat family protein n=1 Tax=Muriicola soli TaxID=2507538 RepID=A0A411E8C3_9FLAO|nr:DUF6624 domain-containing protein [Muriicola soli]QBA63985.1 hypothetical protein EQY75_05190 [Muriicola soli]